MSTHGVRGGLIVGLGLGLGGSLLGLSCADAVPTKQACAQACDTASHCGLLPSALGGQIGSSQAKSRDDCVRRCQASDVDDQQIDKLLEILGDPAYREIASLCAPGAVSTCEELIEDMTAEAATNELSMTTRLTVRMTSAVSFVAQSNVESWCCFDYTYDFDDGMPPAPEDTTDGDGIDELTAVYDMFEPTYTCLRELEGTTKMLEELLEPDPDQPPPPPDGPPDQDVMNLCATLVESWTPDDADDMGMMPEPDDHCRFARKSSLLRELDVVGAAMACDYESIRVLQEHARRTLDQWHLIKGTVLIDDEGNLREPEDIRAQMLADIRDELSRPLGFLEEACEEFFEEQGEQACETLDRQEPPEQECSGGPLCSPADCLANSSGCDPALCESDPSAPTQDCEFFGIEQIKLGYKTKDGLEIFGEPIEGCSSIAGLTSTIEGVKVGVVRPIAVVSGHRGITSLGETADTRAFSWYIEGDPRWISAGSAEIQLASPKLEFLEMKYDNPLQFLGWVPEQVPVGQTCDNQPDLCEKLANGNCEDGLDNDGDGAADEASPWCDELFQELIDRCVVDPLGEQPNMKCREPPPEEADGPMGGG